MCETIGWCEVSGDWCKRFLVAGVGVGRAGQLGSDWRGTIGRVLSRLTGVVRMSARGAFCGVVRIGRDVSVSGVVDGVKFSSFGARFWAWIVSARWTIGAGVLLVVVRVFLARDWLVLFLVRGLGCFLSGVAGRVLGRLGHGARGRYLAGLFKWLNGAFSRRDCPRGAFLCDWCGDDWRSRFPGGWCRRGAIDCWRARFSRALCGARFPGVGGSW